MVSRFPYSSHAAPILYDPATLRSLALWPRYINAIPNPDGILPLGFLLDQEQQTTI